MKKKRWILVLITIMTLTLVACTSANDKENATNNTNRVEGQEIVDNNQLEDNNIGNMENPLVVAYEDIKLTPEDVFDKYKEKYTNTKVKKMELDRDDGSYVYKIKGYNKEKEYKLEIDPVSGKVLTEDIDDDDDNNGEISKAHVQKIQGLVDASIKDAGEGAKLDEWELELEDNKPVLEVEVDVDGRDDIEYKYDVQSGALIEKDE